MQNTKRQYYDQNVGVKLEYVVMNSDTDWYCDKMINTQFVQTNVFGNTSFVSRSKFCADKYLNWYNQQS